MDINCNILVNGKLKREYNGGIFFMEKEKFGENWNVLYNFSYKNKYLSYIYVVL